MRSGFPTFVLGLRPGSRMLSADENQDEAAEFLRVIENKRLSFTVIASLLIVLVPVTIKILLELLISLLPN